MNTQAKLNLDVFVPYFIAVIANKSRSSGSKIYLEKFGVGVPEWQAMVVFALHGEATAQNIADIVGIDKSACSRSVKKLKDMGVITQVKGKFVGRNKPLVLTDDGWELYKKIEAIALKREEIMLASFTEDEKQVLLGFLKRIKANTANLSENTQSQ
jgi:DNA-binding MarR family transcriptional regulator